MLVHEFRTSASKPGRGGSNSAFANRSNEDAASRWSRARCPQMNRANVSRVFSSSDPIRPKSKNKSRCSAAHECFRMRIAVEKSKDKHLLHHQVRDARRDFHSVEPRLVQQIKARSLDRVHMFERQNPLRGIFMENRRHIDGWFFGKLMFEPFHMRRFRRKVNSAPCAWRTPPNRRWSMHLPAFHVVFQQPANCAMISRSSRTIGSIPGRCTLITHWSPV